MLLFRESMQIFYYQCWISSKILSKTRWRFFYCLYVTVIFNLFTMVYNDSLWCIMILLICLLVQSLNNSCGPALLHACISFNCVITAQALWLWVVHLFVYFFTYKVFHLLHWQLYHWPKLNSISKTALVISTVVYITRKLLVAFSSCNVISL